MTLSFVCIGPQRTGTSWLDQMLRRHPAVCLPHQVKETFYFDVHFSKGRDWYEWHFRHRQDGQICGEVAPTYFAHADAGARLHAYAPEVQVVAVLRCPLDRTYSLYRHHLTKGRVSGTFSEAVEQMPQILESGCYASHLSRWIGLFGPANVHVLLYDDLAQQPSATLDHCWRILDAPPIAIAPADRAPVGAGHVPRLPRLARIAAAAATALRARRLHRVVEAGKRLGLARVYRGGSSQPSLTPAERHRILEYYDGDVTYVERLLERSLPHWRSPAQSAP